MKRRSGFAMLAALMLMSLLAIIAIAILSMSAASRRRAVRLTRTEVREGCAYSGMMFARTYFANNFGNWSTYLSAPNKYNPINPTNLGSNLPITTPAWTVARADVSTAAGITAIAVTSPARPELFVDLDGDAQADAYIFIRDNMDEVPPTPNDFQKDNDQNVIVGAICISKTMLPKREDGTVDADRLMMEAMLAYNAIDTPYAQSRADGNLNN